MDPKETLMRWTRLIVATLLCFAPRAASADDTPRRFVVELRLLQVGADEQGPSKLLAEPAIAASIDRAFSFRSGGEVSLSKTNRRFDLGVLVEGRLSAAPAASEQELDVDLKLTLDVIAYTPEKIEQVSRSIAIHRIVQLGRTERIALEDRFLLELTVSPSDTESAQRTQTMSRPDARGIARPLRGKWSFVRCRFKRSWRPISF